MKTKPDISNSQMMLPPVRFRAALFFGLTVFLPLSMFGQDTVLIKRETGKITKRTGQVTDWTGDKITLDSGGRERIIDAAQVVDVQSQWPDELVEARSLLARQLYPEGIGKYQQARNDEKRNWVKQIITSELLQAYDALENPTAATQEFLRLYSADPESRFFHLIPLPWSTGGVKGPGDAETRKWIEAKSNLLRLLGASWRLSSSSRTDAIAILEELSADSDKRIAQLATTQLWRTRVFSANQQDVERWQRQLHKIPASLRAGPLVILADAQSRIGKSEQAQISLLKIPILYPEKRSLAAFALYRCGSILDDNKATDKLAANKAVMIWQELIRDFPTSQYAEIAKSKL